MESQAPSSAPPGWYPDVTGAVRWWDGQAWGPLAVPPAPPANKTLAIVTHLGPVLGGFILPLVIYCVCDKNDRYVVHHSSEGLNFSLTLLIVQVAWMALGLLAFVGLAAGRSAGAALGLGAFGLVWLAGFAVTVAGWVFAILAAVRASQGQWYRYPVCIRFVKGAVPPDTPPLW